MKSMTRPSPEKCLKTGSSDPFLFGIRKKNSRAFAVSFGADMPACYSLVLCDLSWGAIAPTRYAIVVNEGLHGRASQEFFHDGIRSPCTKRNRKKSHEEKMVWTFQGYFLSQQLTDQRDLLPVKLMVGREDCSPFWDVFRCILSFREG